jgi:hypothetical protein
MSRLAKFAICTLYLYVYAIISYFIADTQVEQQGGFWLQYFISIYAFLIGFANLGVSIYYIILHFHESKNCVN